MAAVAVDCTLVVAGPSVAPVTAPPESTPEHRSALMEGTRVEVRSGFDGSWDTGFQIHQITESGYLLRRRSDKEVLPVEFSADDLRREHKTMWWY